MKSEIVNLINTWK